MKLALVPDGLTLIRAWQMPLSQRRGSKEEGIIRVAQTTLELFNALPVNSRSLLEYSHLGAGYS